VATSTVVLSNKSSPIPQLGSVVTRKLNQNMFSFTEKCSLYIRVFLRVLQSRVKVPVGRKRPCWPWDSPRLLFSAYRDAFLAAERPSL